MCKTRDTTHLAPSAGEMLARLDARLDRLERLERERELVPGLHTETRLRCPHCHTLIRYVDEAPPWRTSQRLQDLMDEADVWLAENDGEVLFPIFRVFSLDQDQARVQREKDAEWYRFQPVLDVVTAWGTASAKRVNRERDPRCVDCLACGAEVFVEHAEEVEDAGG